jgi:hypothetical protein
MINAIAELWGQCGHMVLPQCGTLFHQVGIINVVQLPEYLSRSYLFF